MATKITEEQKKILLEKEWSHSSISSFRSCPYSFYRTYILGDRRKLPKTFFGSVFHRYAESFTGTPFDFQEVHKEFPFTQDKLPDFEKCKANFSSFFEKNIKGKRVKSEYEVHLKIGKYPIVLIIDLVVLGSDLIQIYDWKTSRNSDYSSSYKEQMGLYQWGASQLFPGKKVEVNLYYPQSDEIVPMRGLSFDPVSTEQFIDSIIEIGEFPCHAHKWCSSCPYIKETCEIYARR